MIEQNKKRFYKRRVTTVVCDNCGKNFQKPVSEVNRNNKTGRHNYCCRKCSAAGASQTRSNLPHRPATEKLKKHLNNICGNRRDIYSPFKYTYRCIKRRFQETNLTLEDLKELWEKQDGICPYTGFKLILPENSNLATIDFFHRASLDRIDSSLGYIKGNVQFVSTPINLLKSTQSDKETKKFLKEISEFTSKFIID